ncbi:MAG: hypothetical protein DCC71_12930 [Proteobacteria bacterium]|nr:MAG: hypothetical protein DCC71_12930 [Pseudomonadota bacterium]
MTTTLRKLLLFSTGEPDAPTSAQSIGAMSCLAHVWEWIELIASSPAPSALEAARSLRRAVLIDARFATPPALRTPAMRAALVEHARSGVAVLDATGADAVLLVTDAPYFRAAWEALGAPSLPAEAPEAGAVALLTRRADGSWRAGRQSSDPPPLRSTLENGEVVDPCELTREPLRHVAPLQLARLAGEHRREVAAAHFGEGRDV